jgi:hypothetical protein
VTESPVRAADPCARCHARGDVWPWKTKEGDSYFCQATALARATSRIRMSELRQFVDLFSGDAGEDITLADKLVSVGIYAHDFLQQYVPQGSEWGVLRGECTRTPSLTLGLRPGERVRVKSREEIARTLDARGWNRGMEFSGEMQRLYGREYTVLRRVERIIRDDTAKILPVRNTVILEGAVYKNLNRLAVPRVEYMFWRECWLERVS